MNNVVIDISKWQWNLDYKGLKEHSPVKAVVVKCSQGKIVDERSATHLAGLQAVKMPAGVYHWYDPYVDVKDQLEVIRATLIKHPQVRFVTIDVEQYGYTYRNLPPIKDAQWLSDKIYSLVTGVKTLGVNVGIYTRALLILEKFKPMLNWLYDPSLDISVWLASWPFDGTAVSTTWDALMSTWAPKTFLPYYSNNWPTDKRHADAWQWSGDKFLLPFIMNSNNKLSAVDLNYFSDETLARFTESAPSQPSTSEKLLLKVYNELVDLKNHNVKELDYILKLIKPEG